MHVGVHINRFDHPQGGGALRDELAAAGAAAEAAGVSRPRPRHVRVRPPSTRPPTPSRSRWPHCPTSCAGTRRSKSGTSDGTGTAWGTARETRRGGGTGGKDRGGATRTSDVLAKRINRHPWTDPPSGVTPQPLPVIHKAHDKMLTSSFVESFRLTEAALRGNHTRQDPDPNHGTRGDGAPPTGTGTPCLT